MQTKDKNNFQSILFDSSKIIEMNVLQNWPQRNFSEWQLDNLFEYSL